jgi:hypothetical protein
MDFLLGFLDVFGDLLLQLLCELIFRSLDKIVSEHPEWNIRVNVFRPFLIGAIFGGFSLLVIPGHITRNKQIRILNLFITPILVGFVINFLGKIREKKNLPALRFSGFSAGYSFALAMAIVRFVWAK